MELVWTLEFVICNFMTMDVYDKTNKKVGTIEVSDQVFKAGWNPALVHQVLVAQIANRRKSLASTKDRSEVRGGGRKPWQQKGLGRARHGSIRSPLWRGGGVTHGPRPEKNYGKKVNKKMKRAAIHSVLSKKAADGEIKIIEDLNLPDYKTKGLAALLKNFFQKRPSLLIVPAKGNKNIFRAARNIPKIKVLEPAYLNVYDGLAHKYIFFEKEAIKEIL